LYKTPLTATAFKDFSASYQHFMSEQTPSPDQAFVYVDAAGVKLVTSVVDEKHKADDGVFALSMAGDGWMEMLALFKAS
jgi:hypothetical protein